MPDGHVSSNVMDGCAHCKTIFIIITIIVVAVIIIIIVVVVSIRGYSTDWLFIMKGVVRIYRHLVAHARFLLFLSQWEFFQWKIRVAFS